MVEGINRISLPDAQQSPIETGKYSVVEVFVAGNKGFCGGVRATLREAYRRLEAGEKLAGTHPSVHNDEEIRLLKEKGMRLEPDPFKIRGDETAFFSAHGERIEVYAAVAERGLNLVDTTCTVVEGIHRRVKRGVEDGKHVIYLAKKDHQETLGVVSEAGEENITVIEALEDIDKLSFDESQALMATSLTTLPSQYAEEAFDLLKAKFPWINIPKKSDICRAVQVRQDSLIEMLPGVNALLVVGSEASNNSQSLREIGAKAGLPSYLINRPGDIVWDWFTAEIERLGVTAGASTSDKSVEDVLDSFRQLGSKITYLTPVADESDEPFKLPPYRFKDYSQASNPS